MQGLSVDRSGALKPKKWRRVWRVGALVATVCLVLSGGLWFGLTHSIVRLGFLTEPFPRHIKMTSQMVGWAEGNRWRSEMMDQVIRTTDGGKTWNAFDFPGQPEGILVSFFLDDQTAWVAPGSALYPGRDTPLMHTTDGGFHWTALKLPPDMWNLFFLDQQHGWAWGGIETSSAGSLYKTVDGGATWSRNTTTSWGMQTTTEPGSSSSLRSFDLTFQTPQRGWITLTTDTYGQADSSQAFLYLTTDGGETWQLQSLPEPTAGPIPGVHKPLDANEGILDIQPPIFFNAQEGLLPITLTQMDPKPFCKISLYATRDNGASWALTGSPLEHLGACQAGTARDRNHFLLWDGNVIALYALAQSQWQLQMGWKRAGKTGDFSLIKGQFGWLYISDHKFTNPSTGTLMMTSDGGLSWHEAATYFGWYLRNPGQEVPCC